MKPKQRAERRHAILEAVAGCAQSFLSTPSWQTCLSAALESIGKAAEASRAYVFGQAEPGYIQMQCSWSTSESLRPVAEDMRAQALGTGPFARWDELLMAGQVVRNGATPFEPAEEAALEVRSVRSVVQIPIFIRSEWWGFIGFDDCEKRRDWSEGEVDALRTLAGLIGSAVQRSRIEQALEQTRQNLEVRVAERTAELAAVNRELQGKIEEQNRDQLLLRQQAQIIDQVADAVVCTDWSGTITFWNRGAEHLLGYSAGEAIGRHVSFAYPPEDRERLQGQVALLQTRGQHEYETRLVHKDGTIRHGRVSLCVLHDEGGAPIGMSGYTIDVTEEKRIGQALRESEGRLRAFTEAMPDVAFIVDEDGRYVDVLAHDTSLLYDAQERLKGRLLHEVFPGEDADRFVETIRRTLQTGQSQSHEYEIQVAAGKRWFEARTAPILNQGLAKRQIIWVARDVTQRHRAAEDLRQAHERLQATLGALPDLLFEVDRELRICDYRAPDISRLYIPPQRFLGRHVEEVLPPDAARITTNACRKAFERGTCKGVVYSLPMGGHTQWYELSLSVKGDRSSPNATLIAMARDITDTRQAEQAVRASEEKYRTLVESLNVGVTRTARLPTPKMVHANPAAVNIFGYASPEEFMALPIPDLFADIKDRERYLDALRQHGSVSNYQLPIRRKDGSTSLIAITATVHKNAQGQIEYIDGILQDISAQVEAQAHRERLSRAIENAGEGIGTLDENWRLTYANEALSRIFGASHHDILGRYWGELFADNSAGRQENLATLLHTRDRWTGRLRGRKQDGQTIPLAVTLARMSQSEGAGLIVVNLRDQSDEEAHLAQIRKLTLEAATSLEQERARLSRELHDELGQILTAINLNLAWLSARSTGMEKVAEQRLTETKQLVNQMLDAVRSLSTSLRPPILDTRGLLEAIRSYAGGFARRAGFSCRVVATPSDMEVRDPLATPAFRIIQEALTNVARHSRASKCGIFLKHTASYLEIQIRDNGVGAVADRLEGVQSLGIAGMRERAAAVGGTLTVHNRSEGGVCVTARMPWNQ